MYHSIQFTDDKNTTINTWDNWHLIPSSRPVIVQPTPIYKYVDIPGRDGTLDTTDYLIGRPTYTDRKGTLEFIAANIIGNVKNYGNEYDPKKLRTGKDDPFYFSRESATSYGDWASRRSQIAAFLDGRKMKVRLYDDDRDYYYYGRVFFREWRPDPQFSKVIIEYQLNPYKYTLNGKEAGL